MTRGCGLSPTSDTGKYYGDWDFAVEHGTFRHEDGGSAVVFAVAPTKMLAFAEGQFRADPISLQKDLGRHVSRWFPGFDEFDIHISAATIHGICGGQGPPLLLLHGIPETHLMWHWVAPALAEAFTVVATDLRGFGASGPRRVHLTIRPYSMREIARDQVEVMEALGHRRFSVQVVTEGPLHVPDGIRSPRRRDKVGGARTSSHVEGI